MLENESKVNQTLLGYCRTLIADIPDERLAEQPMPGVNHPAWILGHLAISAEHVCTFLGESPELPATWTTLFGPGSQPLAVRANYPAKDELVQTLDSCFARARVLAAAATVEQLAQPSPHRYTRRSLPTMNEAVAFLLVAHLGIHVGQLTMWRRMIGMTPLF